MKRNFIRAFSILVVAGLAFSFFSCSKSSNSKLILKVGVMAGPVSLDPRLATDAEGIKITRLISEGLFTINENLEVVPLLAEKIEQLSNTSYRFTIKKGVKFHDGSDLTADDVAYTYNSIRQGDVASPFRGAYDRIKDVVVESPDVIRIDLKEPYSPFTTSLIVGIVPKAIATKDQQAFAKAPIGTGPYKFVEYVQDSKVVLKANELYRGSIPKIPTLFFDIVKDENVRVMKIMKGDIDLVQNSIPPMLLDQVKKSNGVEEKDDVGIVMTYMGLNLQDPILSNGLVRKALAYAIDRDAVISHRYKGMAVKANSILAPSNWAYDKSLPQYEYDPKKAKELLDQAGFTDPDGDGPQTRFTLVYKTSSNKERIDTAQMIAYQLGLVGISARVEPYEWGKLYDDIKKGNFQMYSMSWSLLSEPDMFYDICNSSQWAPNGVNRSRYKNAQVDVLTEQARLTQDFQKRKALYADVQKIVLEDLPYIPLWYEKNIVVFRKDLKNVRLRPDASYATLAEIEK